MEINYRSNKLKKTLSNERLMKKYYPNIHNNLKSRLTELSSASNLAMISHVPPPRRHKLLGNYKDCWAVDVSNNQRLIFSPVNENVTNVSDITQIIIERIKDYH